MRTRTTLNIMLATVVGLVVGPPAVAATGGRSGRPRSTASRQKQARARPHAVTLEWVGDMALSTELGLPPGGVARSLGSIKSQLENADVTAGNLEGTLSSGGASKCGGPNTSTCFAFQAPASYAQQYRSLGFDVVNQANNHAMDYGASGHDQTDGALKQADLAYTGSPDQISYLTVHGARVAFIGFAPYSWASNLLDIAGAKTLVRRAKAHASLVVVFIHAGAEGAEETHTPHGTEYFLGENRGDSRAFAHGVIDAGASIVLGSGPHVIRGVERYRGRLIAYSLGNFIGYHTLGLGGVLSESAILRVTLGPGGRLLAGDWISITLKDAGLPRLDPSDASARLVGSLSSEDFPSDHWNIGLHGTFHLSQK